MVYKKEQNYSAYQKKKIQKKNCFAKKKNIETKIQNKNGKCCCLR